MVSSGAEGDQWGRGAIKKVETDNALLRSQGGDQIGSDQGKGSTPHPRQSHNKVRNRHFRKKKTQLRSSSTALQGLLFSLVLG